MTYAVYVFADQQCMDLGFTMLLRYFKTESEARKYASGFRFAEIVLF